MRVKKGKKKRGSKLVLNEMPVFGFILDQGAEGLVTQIF